MILCYEYSEILVERYSAVGDGFEFILHTLHSAIIMPYPKIQGE